MQVTLAIDYGSARVGIAVSVGWLARPLEVLPHGMLDSLLERIGQLATQEQVTRFVVGLPINADGSEGEQAAAARTFAQQLATRSPHPVYLWNEYGSSQAAQARLIEGSRRRKGRREMLDAVAAAIFLQEFVEQEGRGAERVEPGKEECDA